MADPEVPQTPENDPSAVSPAIESPATESPAPEIQASEDRSGGWLVPDDAGSAQPEPHTAPRRRRGAGLAWKIALLTLMPLILLPTHTAFFASRTH
ncbi:MAG: hypothetical protein AAGM22_13630, partial [Acidobacteriota bacterium]